MADQVGSGAIAHRESDAPGSATAGGHASGAFHGRSVSWVAVSIVVIGFLVGGLALIFQSWPVFWVGAGLVAVGGLFGLSTGIMNDWY